MVYSNSRIEAIKNKFEAEDFYYKKKKLNIIFVLFLVFTILAMFLVPLYKPGYLPKI